MLKRLALALLFLFTLAPAFASPPPAVPGLPDTERRTSYSITSSNCACSIGFALYGDSIDIDQWVQVWVNGVRKLSTDPTYGWTITSPTGPLATIPRPITDGVLTFNSTQTGMIQIVGARRPRRVTQFNENRGVPARDLNQALTDIIAQNREMWDKINDTTGRSLISQPGNVIGPLPPPASCVGDLLGFDQTGLNPVCYPSQFSYISQSLLGYVGAGTGPVQSITNVPVSLGGTGNTSFGAGLPLIGNGTGAIAVGSVSGNTTAFVTRDGSVTNGHCVQWDSALGLTDAGGVCTTGGGGGTVSSALINQLAFYNAAGTVVVGLTTANNAVLVTNGSGAPSESTTLPSGITAPSLIVTTAFTATGLVTAADLVSGAAVSNIGYTPVNKAGDTMSGSLTLAATTPAVTVNAATGNQGSFSFQVNGSPVANFNGSSANPIVGYDAINATNWLQLTSAGNVTFGEGSSKTVTIPNELLLNDPGGLQTPSMAFTGATPVNGTIAAAASWTIASTSITMGSSNPGWVQPGDPVWDSTAGAYIGSVCSYSGTTLRLTKPNGACGANPQANSTGSTDNLYFTASNQPNFNFVSNTAPGNFGDGNFRIPFVVIGGKADSANVTGDWEMMSVVYAGDGGGTGSSFIVTHNSLMAPVASANNNNGLFFADNPQVSIPTGMTPQEATVVEMDLTTESTPSIGRHVLTLFDLCASGCLESHAPGEAGLEIAKAGSNAIGFNNVINFGDNDAGGGNPLVAGGDAIHFESSSVNYSSLFDAHVLTGSPTNADIWLHAHTGGAFYACFGTTCGGGSIVGNTSANGGSLVYNNNSISFNWSGAEFTVSNTGAINAPGLPTSAGAGGLYVCVDSSGNEYKKASCP